MGEVLKGIPASHRALPQQGHRKLCILRLCGTFNFSRQVATVCIYTRRPRSSFSSRVLLGD